MGLICVSLSEFAFVEVQHGGEVSLLCSNLSRFITNVFWFKMDQRSNATKITSMLTAESNATVQEEFRNGRFQMSSNSTHVSLNISEVNFSDSGLYFCGSYKSSLAVIFDATFLQVEEVSRLPDLQTIILGSIIGFLVMVIVMLFMKIKSRRKAPAERQLKKDLECDTVVSFRRNRIRAAAESEYKSYVVYAATK
uniref:Ig-like domain-containing protein n=1 Tax=Oryzias melastigma TaxID=30732 RepID=A0A3B3DTY5_ORYME